MAIKYFLSFNLPSATTPFPSENKLGIKPLYEIKISFFKSVIIKFTIFSLVFIDPTFTSPPTLIFLLNEKSD